MGRRSINTTKSGKYMNPTDQARKEARKKELKKNKKQRQMVRAAVLKGKDPGQLIEEMEKIDEMEYNVFQPSPLNEKVLKEKRKKLKETFDRVMRLYHNDDPELWAELKRKEVEYEKRRNKKVQYYESVRHAQTVQVDEIPLPMSETPQQNTFIVPAGGVRPLQQQPPPPTTLLTPQNPFVQPPKNINTILTDVISELEQEQQQQQQQPPPPLTIMRQKKTKIHRKRGISKKTKKAPQCPPSPPPDITDSREFDLIYDTKELARIRHKKKRDLKHDDKVRNSKDKRRQIQEPEKMIKSSDIKPPEKDTLKPTSLQQRMLALSGQNIDEFMKEMEVVQMKKQQERAADLHTRLSALDKRQQTGPADNLTKNISSYDHQIGDERSSSHTEINRIKSVHHEEDSNDDDGDNDHDVDDDDDDDDDALSITSCDESCSEYNMSNDSDSSGNFSGYFSSSSRSSSSSDSSEVSDEEFSRNLGETEHAKLLKLKLKEMSITKSLAFQFPNSITTNVRQMSSSIQSGSQQRPPPLPTQPPPPPPLIPPQQQHHILTKSQLSQIRQSTNVPPPPQPPSQTQTTAPITQFIKLPSGPPPPPVGVPPGLMYRPPPPIRPTNMPMGIRMPPGPPPGPRPGSMHGTGNLPPPPQPQQQQQQQPPRLGIRMPPGPPPGIPPARLMLNNPHGPKSTLNTIIGNTLTAGPLLTKDTKGMTTITAKPQIRNLSADVTRFVPSALRIKREDKKQQIKPRPFIQPIRHYDQPKGTTKDDAYMQFMKEMQGLL